MALMGRIRVDSQPRPMLQMTPTAGTFDSSVLSMQDAMGLVNNVTNNLNNGTYGQTLIMELMTLTNCLPYWGQHLEVYYNDQLNRVYVEFRKSASDDRLDLLSRKLLLFLIEMRSSNWQVNEPMSRYFKTDEYMAICNSESPSSASLPSPTLPVAPLLAPGETIKTSGKFPKPTKIPGKNYYKDEVVIRNSDSGKVMGIKGRRVHMIEELSETVISFQRVNPGAKERLVQVTGADEAHINYAKQLMGDTIRRNASPVPCRSDQLNDLERPVGGSSSSVNSSASEESAPQGYPRSRLHHSLSTNDASIGDYKYTVMVGNNAVKITGADYTLVMKSKLALDKFFESEPHQQVDCGEFFTSYDEADYLPAVVEPIERVSKSEPTSVPSQVQSSPEPQTPSHIDPVEVTTQMSPMYQGNEPKRRYSWSTLCKLSQLPLCREAPTDWDQLCPAVLRKVFVSPPVEPSLSVEPIVHVTNNASLLRMTSLPAGIGETKLEHNVGRRASQPLYTVSQIEVNQRRAKPLFADIETEKSKRVVLMATGDTQTQTESPKSDIKTGNRTKPLFGDIKSEIKRRISYTSLIENENIAAQAGDTLMPQSFHESELLHLRSLSSDISNERLCTRAARLQLTAELEMAEITGAISLPVHFKTQENMALYDVNKRCIESKFPDTPLLEKMKHNPPGVQPDFDFMAAHAALNEAKVPLGRSRSLPYQALLHPTSPKEEMLDSSLYKTTIPFRPVLTNSNIKAQNISNLAYDSSSQSPCASLPSSNINSPEVAAVTQTFASQPHSRGAYHAWAESQGHISPGLKLPLNPSLSPTDLANEHVSNAAAYQSCLNMQAAALHKISPEFGTCNAMQRELDSNPADNSWTQSQTGEPGSVTLTSNPEMTQELIPRPILLSHNPLNLSPDMVEPNFETTISFRPKFAYSRSMTSPEIDSSLSTAAKEYLAVHSHSAKVISSEFPQSSAFMQIPTAAKENPALDPVLANKNTSVFLKADLLMPNTVGSAVPAVSKELPLPHQILPVAVSPSTVQRLNLIPEAGTEVEQSIGVNQMVNKNRVTAEEKAKLLKSFRPMITNPKLAFINKSVQKR